MIQHPQITRERWEGPKEMKLSRVQDE